MVAKTLDGFEGVLEKELRQLGAQDIKPLKRAVSFKGDTGFLYKANLWLRTALRILKPIAGFEVNSQEEFYNRIKKLPWEKWLSENQTFRVNATIHSELFTNSQFVELRTKDAIVDRFRERTGQRPSVQLQFPDLYVQIHLNGNRVTVSLDASGEPLFKRGYEREAGPAPINEVLAAGILLMSEWRPPLTLLDPMCGSGTFLIEAALIGRNLPPCIYRKDFAFMKWADYDAALFELIKESAFKKAKDGDLPIFGSDNNGWVLEKCASNLERALFDEDVRIRRADFLERTPPAPNGIVVMNPPYDIKIHSNNEALYKGIGATLKHQYTGWTAWILTGDLESVQHIGLKPSRKIKLKNGALDVLLLKYEMFAGKRGQGTRE